MQQEKYHQPIFLETAGQVLVSARPPQHQPSVQKTSLFFAGLVLSLVSAIAGLLIGNYLAERKVIEAQEALKLSELQKAATRRQIEKFCTESLGGR